MLWFCSELLVPHTGGCTSAANAISVDIGIFWKQLPSLNNLLHLSFV
jgi:hypothetical protein